MSHVATLDIRFKECELDCLERAVESLGLKLIRNQTSYRWYGRWVKDYHGTNAAYKNGIDPKDYGKCDHVITIQGDNTSYEIGLVRMPDGSYTLIWDFWGSGEKITSMIGGQDGGKLKAEFSKQITIAQAQIDGYSTEITEDAEYYDIIMTDYSA